MKKVIILMVLPLVVLNLMVVSKSKAQDTKPAAKTEKHIKIITVKDGVKEEVDTVIVGGDKRIIITKHGNGVEPLIIQEMETEGDSGKKVTVHVETLDPEKDNLLFFNEGKRGSRRMITAPREPGFQRLQAAPALRYFQNRGNVINLSDPGVISFKKKKLSGGREKIIVIRNEVKDTKVKPSDVFFDTEGGDLKKMNEPRVVRELEIKKRDLGHPIERKVEIKTTPEPEKK